jgi:polysaccharide export outer membrane protein
MKNMKKFLILSSVALTIGFIQICQAQETLKETGSSSDLKTMGSIPSQDPANPVPSSVPRKMIAGAYNSQYTLGPEDVITITVLRHPEVSGQYVINSEGKIQYEFVGDEVLLGLTKDEAQQVIAKRLETFIVNPEVTVKITEYNSKVVYVVGEVGAPGKIFMRGDTITVRDALLAASLPQLTAATEHAKLFTPSETGRVRSKKVNVYALLYKGDLRENYVMKPGDTIYLPATLWAKVARFINPVTQPVSQTAGTAASVGM